MQVNSMDGMRNVIEFSKQLPVNQNGEVKETGSTRDKQENTVKANDDNSASVSESSVIEAIEKANKLMINNNTKAEFSVHKGTKTIIVKIIDIESNKVLREFPPEKILDLIAKLCELAGVLVDERR
jgi:flagellar protein FlaG